MFKFISLFALMAIASAAPGYIAQTHSIVQPVVLAKTSVVDTSSAITHQSFTNLVKKVPVVHTYAAAPTVVKTISTPVVHTYTAAAPTVVKTISTPVVHTYSAAPVLKTISSPVVHTYAAAATPVVKTIVSSPVAYTNLYHH